MDYPIKNGDELTIEDFGIKPDSDGRFTLKIKEHIQIVASDELISEMKDQLNVRGSVRNALLRKANKEILAGLKKGRLRLDEETREVFDLNILIWFADKALKGEYQQYLTK